MRRRPLRRLFEAPLKRTLTRPDWPELQKHRAAAYVTRPVRKGQSRAADLKLIRRVQTDHQSVGNSNVRADIGHPGMVGSIAVDRALSAGRPPNPDYPHRPMRRS